MATNNDYLNDMAGENRNSGKSNNQLLEEISAGGTAGLSPAQQELLDSVNSKADLVDGKVPESQLPSYVDNVQEVVSLVNLPVSGADNVIYVTTDTNKVYRWGGTSYVEVAQTISLGTTSSTAHRGDHGVIAYTHVTDTANPHNVTKTQIGLSQVNNTSDVEKPVSAPQAAAILMKENVITPSTSAEYYRGDKVWATLNKSAVGLSNVDNTKDADKPITQAMLNAFGVKADLVNGKVPASQLPASSGLTLGETDNTAYRGDLGAYSYTHTSRADNPHGTTKSQVGLSNVDNTSDLNKPVSTATASSIATKQNTLASGTNIKTLNGSSVLGAGDLVISADLPTSTTTLNNVVVKQFPNRTEYSCKIAFNRSVGTGINGYVTISSTSILPTGITIDGADEHYISIRNQERDIFVNVWDTSSRVITIGLANTWTSSATAVGTVFLKLVNYK